VTGGLLVMDGNIVGTTSLISKRLGGQLSDIDSLYTYGFLLIIGMIVALLNNTGGAIACAQSIIKKIRTKKAAEMSSVALSFLLSIDDYLSILTTGYVMQPLTDQFRISRLKLAFLVHSLAGVLVVLVPISSWAAFLTSQLDIVGINLAHTGATKIAADPFFVHLQSIPFIFYSLLMIGSVLFIIKTGISFGPMAQCELELNNQVSNEKNYNPTQFEQTRGTTADLLVPLITLISSVLIGIAYTGGYYLFGGTNTLLQAFQSNNQTFFVMFMAGILTLVISSLFALIRNVTTFNQLPLIISGGFSLMLSPIIVVILASTLGTMLKTDLLTGNYLASLLIGKLSLTLLPVTFFLVSLIMTLFTGSAWGTFALMLSITIPMLISLLEIALPTTPTAMPILFPVLGAIFSGAICGDHISPISETTIMTATSTGTNPIEHAYTQFPYALPAIIGSIIGFLLTGFLMSYSLWINALVSLGTGFVVCFGLLYIFSNVFPKIAKE
jgi:tetracycline resistance efflux pump